MKALTCVRAICVRCGKIGVNALNLRFKRMRVENRVVSQNKEKYKKTHKNLRISKKSSNFAAWKSGGILPLELLKPLKLLKLYIDD